MSKVAEYLQGHMVGEISAQNEAREALSRDGSILQIKPELIAYPRVTNDIRKVMRFAWQLAEKGHPLAVTARGGGSDQTGAALTKGVSMVFTAHMNKIYEYDPKQHLIRVQPGANMLAVNQSLNLYGAHIPAAPTSAAYSTIGGAVANNAASRYSGSAGQMREYVSQLEVILANGDVVQTGRMSRREFNKKKGMQGLEGDIYRGVETVLEDYADIIADKLSDGQLGNFGYAIADVRRKDGSFDLTPLFIGSQGTLGIISEMIMRADPAPRNTALIALVFRTSEAARDALDIVRRFQPGVLDYYEGSYLEYARKNGKVFANVKTAEESSKVGALLIAEFTDLSERHQAKHIKKMRKALKDIDVTIAEATDDEYDELRMIDVLTYHYASSSESQYAPALVDGIQIPHDRFENFCERVSEIEKKHEVTLPVYGHAIDGIYYLRPQLDMSKVSGKQKALKLLAEISGLCAEMDGVLVAESGEGRLKTSFVAELIDPKINELFAAIKKAFDPYNILNPGVKQPEDLKKVVSNLSSVYPAPHLADEPMNY